MTLSDTLLPKVKENFILQSNDDDTKLAGMIDAAVAYAEGFQHCLAGYYSENAIPPNTERGIIMLASYLYENSDNDDFYASSTSIHAAVNDLLRMDHNLLSKKMEDLSMFNHAPNQSLLAPVDTYQIDKSTVTVHSFFTGKESLKDILKQLIMQEYERQTSRTIQ